MTDPRMPESHAAYWMGVAMTQAAKATCRRRNVGAVLVVNGNPVGYGHNWTPRDTSCDAGDCPRGVTNTATPGEPPYDDCLSIHAEATALYSAAARLGVPAHVLREIIEGGTLYVTGKPCGDCEMLIRKFGLVTVYPDQVA